MRSIGQEGLDLSDRVIYAVIRTNDQVHIPHSPVSWDSVPHPVVCFHLFGLHLVIAVLDRIETTDCGCSEPDERGGFRFRERFCYHTFIFVSFRLVLQLCGKLRIVD